MDIRVVVLADVPHSCQGSLVLVGGTGADIVERSGVTWIPIRGSEVNANSEVDLAPTHDVLQECVLPVYLGNVVMKHNVVHVHVHVY